MTQTLFFTNIPPMGWLIIAVVVLVLFGRGKISSLMGEVGKGITSFKRGVREGTEEIEQEMKADTQDIPEAEIAEEEPAKKPRAKKGAGAKKAAKKGDKKAQGKDKS